jgi:two-component system sensor histidine kinase CpxA
MNPRFPLAAKLLIWFTLNLVLLIVITWLALRFATKAGFNSFLAGHVGGRVAVTARALINELEDLPRAEWNATVARYEAAQPGGVRFLVLDIGRQVLAGEPVPLPDLVMQQLPLRPPAPPRPGDEPPPGREPRNPPPPLGTPQNPRPAVTNPLPPHLRGSGPTAVGGRDNAWPDSAPRRGPEPAAVPVHHRFLVQTENPRTYWVGLFMGLRDEQHPEPSPVLVLARAATFSAGGFFFNYMPWIFACAGIVALCGLFWLPFVTGMTRSIRQMTRATRQIADGHFDVRVDATRTDELGQLGSAVNRMSTRLEGFVTGQKRTLGDIAHELCSPVARLQMTVGILEQHAPDAQKETLEDLREEVQHMSDLVNELLSFSKASLRPADVKRKTVHVRAIAAQAARREAADLGEVTLDIPENLTCLASPELLQRAISNLIRNSLRYAGQSGPVTITACAEGSSCVITISDNGPGVPAEHLGRIFDAFYRIEPDRARETGGAGLGLAIVKTCIEACGGSVTAHNREPRGLEVTLVLPVA